MPSPFAFLPPYSKDNLLHVIVETPAGSRNKLKFDEEHRIFRLSSVLPAGVTFPYDFGYVPSTRAADGDPIDVLLLMDVPVFTGCLVEARLVGVIEAEQTEDGKTSRNDRLIAVAAQSPTHQDTRGLEDLPPHLLDQIENFFLSYARMQDKKLKFIGRRGPKHAEKLVKAAVKAAEKG